MCCNERAPHFGKIKLHVFRESSKNTKEVNKTKRKVTSREEEKEESKIYKEVCYTSKCPNQKTVYYTSYILV